MEEVYAVRGHMLSGKAVPRAVRGHMLSGKAVPRAVRGHMLSGKAVPRAVRGHMLSGKAVPRAVRGNLLLLSALYSLLLSSQYNNPLPENSSKDNDLYDIDESNLFADLRIER